MYFDILGFVFAKKKTKKQKTCAINRQTVVVTSLKMASLDHSELTRAPQVDIFSSVSTDSSSHVENPHIGTISSQVCILS